MDFSSTGGGEGLGTRLGDNTVMPHPSGWWWRDYEGVAPSSMPFGRGISFSLILGIVTVLFALLCSTDLLKETAPVE